MSTHKRSGTSACCLYRRHFECHHKKRNRFPTGFLFNAVTPVHRTPIGSRFLNHHRVIIMDNKIVRPSIFETIQLHFLSFVYGLYLIAKRLLKWAWDPKKFFVLRQRDRPPTCLIDNSLGTHSYVKIKVRKLHCGPVDLAIYSCEQYPSSSSGMSKY